MNRGIYNTVSSTVHTVPLHGYYDLKVGNLFKYVRDVYRYQKLNETVLIQLASYLNYFSSGDYTGLNNHFTTPTYNTIVLNTNNTSAFYNSTIDNLSNFTYNDTMFEQYRVKTFGIIDGLWKTKTLITQNNTLEEQNQIYKNILNDPVLLEQYITQNKLNMIAFQASESFNVQIVLKPWYSAYLQQYGPPGNGVFNSEYLAQIVATLIASGQITEEEFING